MKLNRLTQAVGRIFNNRAAYVQREGGGGPKISLSPK